MSLAFPKPEPRARKRKPLRAKPPRELPPAEAAYLRWVRSLECRARLLPGHRCRGIMTAHHAGRRPGMGLKCHYMEAIPLCWDAHLDGIEILRGVFKLWTREEVRAWEDEQIGEVRTLARPGDDRDRALELQRLGLGRIEARDGGGWAWIEATDDEEGEAA